MVNSFPPSILHQIGPYLDQRQIADALAGIIYSGVAGREGFDVASSPYSTDSMQWIASMTKFIMTTCILQLVGKGLVGLNEDLRPRFPELGSLPILEGFNGNGEAILVENTEPLTLQ